MDFCLQMYVLGDSLLRAGEIEKKDGTEVCVCELNKNSVTETHLSSGRMLEEFSPCLGRSQIRNVNQVAIRL